MTPTLLVLLPPSETKRDGGSGVFGAGPWEGTVSTPRWPQLQPIRDGVRDRLVELAADEAETARALGISAKLAVREAARNRALRDPDVLPAALRYTGVLYDALDARTLDADAWAWLGAHVAVHSALYGLVGAGEPIAAYRCSAGSKLGAPSLGARWSGAISRALDAHEGTILDLRSSSYTALGPAVRAISVDLVTVEPDGRVRALNHFNKQAKGELVRALATTPLARALPGDVEVEHLASTMRTMGWHATVVSPTRLRIEAAHPSRK